MPPKKKTKAPPEEDKTSYSRTMQRLEQFLLKWERVWADEVREFRLHPRRVIWVNLWIGISRGVGFVLGVSVVGAILLTIVAWVFSHFVSLPVIGKYIAVIVEYVQEYLTKK